MVFQQLAQWFASQQGVDAKQAPQTIQPTHSLPHGGFGQLSVSETTESVFWQAAFYRNDTLVLDALLHYYSKQGITGQQASQPTLRKAWCEWQQNSLLALEGLGLAQRCIEDNRQNVEARYMHGVFQWHCGLKLKAIEGLNQVVSSGSAPSALVVLARQTLLQWHQSNPYHLNPLTLSMAVSSQWVAYHWNRLLQPWIAPVAASSEKSTPVLPTAKHPSNPMDALSPEQEAVELNKTIHCGNAHPSPVAFPPVALPTLQELEALRSRCEASPQNAELVYQTGQMALKLGAATTALYYFKRTVSLLPHHAKAYYGMGESLVQLEDWDGVVEAYKTAIAFGKDAHWTSQVSLQLAKIYMDRLQDDAKAMACLRLCDELHSQNLEALFVEAELLCKQGKYEAAIPLYKTLTQHQPDNGEVYGFLGYLYWQLGQIEASEVAYQQAITLDASNAIAMNNLGVLYMDMQQNLEKALYWFQRAASTDADYTMAQFNLGRIYERQKEELLALRAYSQALQLNEVRPELEEADLQRRIQALRDAQ